MSLLKLIGIPFCQAFFNRKFLLAFITKIQEIYLVMAICIVRLPRPSEGSIMM